jgi:hypothetical protein
MFAGSEAWPFLHSLAIATSADRPAVSNAAGNPAIGTPFAT